MDRMMDIYIRTADSAHVHTRIRMRTKDKHTEMKWERVIHIKLIVSDNNTNGFRGLQYCDYNGYNFYMGSLPLSLFFFVSL